MDREKLNQLLSRLIVQSTIPEASIDRERNEILGMFAQEEKEAARYRWLKANRLEAIPQKGYGFHSFDGWSEVAGSCVVEFKGWIAMETSDVDAAIDFAIEAPDYASGDVRAPS